jgi:hypothetical protein
MDHLEQVTQIIRDEFQRQRLAEEKSFLPLRN